MSLPTDAKARKALPIFTYLTEYFPDALLAEVEVAVLGNEQHNPGEPLHWSREKSTDQLDCAFRHMLDHKRGVVKDIDGAYHLAKAIWRLKAELQLVIEAAHGQPLPAAMPTGAVSVSPSGSPLTDQIALFADLPSSPSLF